MPSMIATISIALKFDTTVGEQLPKLLLLLLDCSCWRIIVNGVLVACVCSAVHVKDTTQFKLFSSGQACACSAANA